MTSYITSVLGNGNIGGVQVALAAAYESRVHTISRLSIPRAQFAGDTAVTLTDGSFNTRLTTTTAAIPKSATAWLANSTNTVVDNTASTAAAPIPKTYGKPLIIKVIRDSFTSDIKSYGVFNADGTYPGSPYDSQFSITAGVNDPFDPAFDPYNPATARYRVNTATGEIYLNRTTNLRDLANPDATIGIAGNGTGGALTGVNGVVGMVEFEALQGGALSVAQQQASELSGVIQSLTSILRSLNDSKKGILSIIR